MTDVFPSHTVETAPAEVRETLAAANKSMGFLPSMLAKFAEAPALLQAYQAAAPYFEKTSLSPTERVVVALAASYRHNCDFCVTAHSFGARRMGVSEDIIQGLRGGTELTDPKLEALRHFVVAMIERRGAVTDDEKQAFFAAGYTPRQALEVILGIALKTFTNYTNALARTPPNPEFGSALWRRLE
jgi:AhpD family alkylhydroperoxidase